MHRHAVKCGNTATVASQTYFFCLARKSRQKEASRMRGAYRLSMTASTKIERCGHHTGVTFPHRTTRRLHRTVLPMIVVATQGHRRIDCRQNNHAPTYSPESFRRKRRCVSFFEYFVGADDSVRPSDLADNSEIRPRRQAVNHQI